MEILSDLSFEKYQKLRNDIDRRTEYLEDVHIKHLKCKNGCDLCCMDYRIFPVEFYFILNRIRKNGKNPEWEYAENGHICVFLKNNSCTIYNNRPIICRTHGLPLLFANDDGDWELSVCDLNFTEFDFEEFEMENTFPQDMYNSKLFLLNKAFIAGFTKKKYDEFDLIPLKEVLKHL